jgi:hypothetical protein
MAIPLNPGATRSGERRQSSRVVIGGRGDIAGLRLVPGLGASIRNLSHGGACIEVTSRLLPGTPVDLQASLPGRRWRAQARILRCHVSAIVADDGLRYEAALQFDLSRDPDAGDRLLTGVLEAIKHGYPVPSDASPSVPDRADTTRMPDHEKAGIIENARNSGT